MCLGQESHPSAPPLTHQPLPPVGSRALLPSRPQKPHAPLPALSRGTSEGCLLGAPPRDATGWAPRGGPQAGRENAEGSESGFSGNEIALCNNESHFFNFSHERAFNCSHCFGSRGNLTSEKAEMKWVWVGILCHFTGLESPAEHSPEAPSQWDRSSLPQRGMRGCIRSPSGGRGRVHCDQNRPRLPRAPMDPHWGGSRDVK